MLEWSRAELASNARVAERTIIDFERGARRTYSQTLGALRAAMEDAGIEFIEENGAGVGVRIRGNGRPR